MDKELSNGELAEKIRSIITTYFNLDEKGNPTIPVSDDVGQIDEMEYSAEVVDRIWNLVRKEENQ